LLARAEKFSLLHIHAAWQMVLDAQRRVILSLEPASALELLLLNLALLPRLVPVEQALPPPSSAQSLLEPDDASRGHARGLQAAEAKPPAPEKAGMPPVPDPFAPPEKFDASCQAPPPPVEIRKEATDGDCGDGTALSWESFLGFCSQRHTLPTFPDLPLPILRQVEGSVDGTRLRLTCTTRMQHQQLSRDAVLTALRALWREYGGNELALPPPAAINKSKAELKEEFSSHPLLQPLKEQFDAQIVTCTPLDASARARTGFKENNV
jgi:DNA polymerase-3 subunit gamma/tau